jgi:hypothetical protein
MIVTSTSRGQNCDEENLLSSLGRFSQIMKQKVLGQDRVLDKMSGKMLSNKTLSPNVTKKNQNSFISKFGKTIPQK